MALPFSAADTPLLRHPCLPFHPTPSQWEEGRAGGYIHCLFCRQARAVRWIRWWTVNCSSISFACECKQDPPGVGVTGAVISNSAKYWLSWPHFYTSNAALSCMADATCWCIFKRAVRSHILHIQLFLQQFKLVFWIFHSHFQHGPVWHQLLLRKLLSFFTASVQKASINITNFPIFLPGQLHRASIQYAGWSWATGSQMEEEEGNM